MINRLCLLFLGTLLVVELAGQSGYCGGLTPLSSSTSFVYFFQGTPITLNGEPVEPGSYIIAVFENNEGEWQCAGELEWQGYNAIMTVRGKDDEYDGYEEGAPYRFYIESPDGCLLTEVAAEFSTDAQFPDGNVFRQGGRSRIAGLSASFAPVVELTTVADTCQAGTGRALIQSVDGQTSFAVSWQDGQGGMQAKGLAGGPFSAVITTNQGCRLETTLEISMAECPLLQCDALVNNRPNGDQGCLPFEVQFTDRSQSEAGIRSYFWDFGDGSISEEANPSHLFQNPGTYEVTFTVSDGYQTDSRTFEVTVLPPATACWSYEINTCKPDQIRFHAESPEPVYYWLWSFENGQSAEGSAAEFTFEQYNTTINGNLYFQDAFGCENWLPLSVEIPPDYDLALSGEAIVPPSCGEANGRIRLSAGGGSPPYAYQWSHDSQFNQPAAYDLPAGDYSVTLTDANDCESTLDIQLEDRSEMPVFSLGEDLELCAGEEVTLAGPVGSGLSYRWSTGAISADITLRQSGLYTLSVTNTDGCVAVDEIAVQLLESAQARISPSGTQACPGEAIMLTGSGGTDFLWLDTSFTIETPNLSEVVVSPAYTTTYGLIAANKCSSDTAFATIQVSPQLVDAGPDTCIAAGSEVQLQASGAVSYQWRDHPSGINGLDRPNPIVAPGSSTYFYVIMTDALGYTYTDSVFVEVLFLEDLPLPAINLITPNGDGDNDRLVFPNLTKFHQIRKLTVFNRWGQPVFESLNYENDWEGTHDGKPLPAGAYFYILRIGDRMVKSSLTIIRE